MKNKLLQYIESRPALNRSELARGMNMKASYFSEKLEEKHGRKFDPAFCLDLAKLLCDYGLNIDEQIFEIDEEMTRSIFSYSFKDDKQESIDKGDHFEYRVTIYRHMYDEFDFWSFITGT